MGHVLFTVENTVRLDRSFEDQVEWRSIVSEWKEYHVTSLIVFIVGTTFGQVFRVSNLVEIVKVFTRVEFQDRDGLFGFGH